MDVAVYLHKWIIQMTGKQEEWFAHFTESMKDDTEDIPS